MIEKFSIFGLHGERNVEISFSKDNPYKILVAENGFGKTSILNAFYAVLSNNVKKLRNINFQEIKVKFFDNEKFFCIEREDLLFGNISLDELSYTTSRYLDQISNNEKLLLIDMILSQDLEKAKLFLKSNFPDILKIRANHIVMDLFHHLNFKDIFDNKNEKKSYEIMNEIYEIINKNELKILYFPTYRRIEESLDNFYFDEDLMFNDDIKKKIEIKSINFGMNDVDTRIRSITDKILKSLQLEFQKLNGQVLSMLIESQNRKNNENNQIDFGVVALILSRLPEKSLSKKNKESILQMIKNKKINNNKPLFQFIKNLIEIYNQQSENEKLIIDFVDKCNRYLVNKKFIYDTNEVKVKIVRGKGNSEEEIKLHMLSSGEKQLISLFANIFLEKEPNMMIFFDEPELSLSIEWQKMILKDIIDSGKCKFLFATTHSPFIFDQLIEYTSDLNKYSTEI